MIIMQSRSRQGISVRSVVFLFLLLKICFSVPNVYGEEVAVVRAGDFKVYKEAQRGFESVCEVRTKEFKLGASVVKDILRAKPELILAIGYDALEAVKDIKGIPVVFAMVLAPHKVIPPGSPITGVDITLPAKHHLEKFKIFLPWARRIGVVYDPNETGYLFRKAESEAKKMGLVLVGRAVKSPEEVIPAIDSLRGEIDVLWMFPDVTVINFESVEYMMLFSYENGIPVYAISDAYVQNGALMALNIDAYDIGKQAGEIANEILAGKDAREIPVVRARKGRLSVNLSAAEKFGLVIPYEVVKTAGKVY
jgi:putative ABC transport system substrate-binding protein